MIKLKELLFGKELKDALSDTVEIKAKGVRFKIRPLNVVNHLEGFNILVESYATYERKKELEKNPQQDIPNLLNKVKTVYRDVFLASVVYPKLARNPGEEGQFVDALFEDWELCHALYEQIMLVTNKKKTIKNTSLNQDFSKLIG